MLLLVLQCSPREKKGRCCGILAGVTPNPTGQSPARQGSTPRAMDRQGTEALRLGASRPQSHPPVGHSWSLRVMGPSEVPPMGHIGQGSPEGSCPCFIPISPGQVRGHEEPARCGAERRVSRSWPP